MGKNKRKIIYDDSLARIFVRSGFLVFVLLLVAGVGIALIMFFYGRMKSDGIKLLLLWLVITVLCSYGLPLLSLLKVWKQERAIGIYWKDRTDYQQPVWERDWYINYDRGGFILCHRNYIKCILASKVETEIGQLERAKVYCLLFEDINGKKHTLKFSSASQEKDFRRWYKKQPDKQKKQCKADVVR